MSTANSGFDLKTLTRHEEYYIYSADLFIIVEHIQFRVHRYFFERESKWFSTRLVTPASPGSPAQGSSDGNSIILENLTSAQFARFLWVFYNPRYSLYEAEVEDWEVILSLAERWAFPEVKNLAVRELEQKTMLDVKRIKLYHANNVDRNYLIPRFAALCEREEPLTLDEGMDLGMETTLRIAAGREQARSRLPDGSRTPLTPTIHGSDLHGVVRELFGIAPPTAHEIAHNSGALPPTQQPSPPPTKPAEKHQQKKTSPPTIQTNTTKKGSKGAMVQPPTTGTLTKPPTPPVPTPPEAKDNKEAKAKKTTTTTTPTPTDVEVGQEKAEDMGVATPAAETDSGSADRAAAQEAADKATPATQGGESAVEPRPDPSSVFNQPMPTAAANQPDSVFGDFAGPWSFGKQV